MQNLRPSNTKVIFQRPSCGSHMAVAPGFIAGTDPVIATHQTWNWVIGSPGQWVIWVIFHVRVTGYPAHRFWPGVRHEFFRFSKKCPKCKNVHLKCWNDKSHCQVSVVGLQSLDVSPCNDLVLLPISIKNSLAWEYFFAQKSTFGIHYRTGSLGQLGLRVAGFPCHWVAGSGTANLASVLFPMTEQDRYTFGQQPGVRRNVQFYVTKFIYLFYLFNITNKGPEGH